MQGKVSWLNLHLLVVKASKTRQPIFIAKLIVIELNLRCIFAHWFVKNTKSKNGL